MGKETGRRRSRYTAGNRREKVEQRGGNGGVGSRADLLGG